jgi:hypothetical protein
LRGGHAAVVNCAMPGTACARRPVNEPRMRSWSESDHDLISLFEHDLRANAPRLSRGKTGFHFALSRPSGSGSCSIGRN